MNDNAAIVLDSSGIALNGNSIYLTADDSSMYLGGGSISIGSQGAITLAGGEFKVKANKG